MKRFTVAAGLALTLAGSLLTTTPASASCIDVPEVGCVNPCTTAERAVYRATGQDLPGDCTA